ncbi:hypothetical protein [Butyrivibrio sp. NC2007]|uniref:hypothetical protein n=1 Tax=Butyrivibrio sp. NC2007 TaxID=1280683 RepID=UPI0003B56577|nr:hypothetical protein [Butyrivibrio sp. NC2007]
MRKELLITKRILAGVAAGLVLFIFAAGLFPVTVSASDIATVTRKGRTATIEYADIKIEIESTGESNLQISKEEIKSQGFWEYVKYTGYYTEPDTWYDKYFGEAVMYAQKGDQITVRVSTKAPPTYVSYSQFLSYEEALQQRCSVCADYFYWSEQKGYYIPDYGTTTVYGGESVEKTITIPDIADYTELYIGADWPAAMVVKIYADNSGPIAQKKETLADNEAGEDEGTDIDNDIVEGGNSQYEEESDDDFLSSEDSSQSGNFEDPFDELDKDDDELPRVVGTGAAGAAVAAGAVGAAGAIGKKTGKKKSKKKDKEKEEEKEDKRSTYKMYVYKDFGDTLKRGDEAKYVYARIEETTWDKRVFTNEELTSQISVSSPTDALIVSDGGMTVNSYKAAEVVVPKEGNKNKGTVTFQFTGVGGSFTRNVVFNIVGENPHIIYPKLADDGVNWLDSSQPGEAVFIAGKGGTEKVMFYIKDAVEEPIDIRFDGGPDFNVSYEKEAAYKCGYYAVVENCSPEIEKANDIIADAVTKTISIESEFKDGTITNSEFYVQLYPDGLSVVPNTKYFKDDIFQVITVAEDNPKPGEIPIMPSSFDVLVCYVDSGTGEAKIFKNPSLSCQKPDDEGRYGNTFKENFEYRIDYTTAGGYDFYPKCTLPMFGKPYDAKMKLIYKGKNGTRFDGDLPIQFWGEIPQPPSEATRREEELKHLRRTIREFGIDNNPNLKIMLSNIEYYSASDIRFVRGYVILLGVHFYAEESRAEIRMVQLCDKYIVTCSALMKSGDYAFSFAMERWFGPAGKVAAAVLNPFKNLLAQYLGHQISEYYSPGGNPELQFVKTVQESFEGAMTELMTGKEKPTPEEMGALVSMYLMSCYMRHYFNGDGKEKGDVYRSVLAALGDLTLVKLKETLSNWIEDHSKGLMEKVAKWFGDKFKAIYGEAAQKAVEAAQKQTFSNVLKDSVKNGSSTFDAAKAALNAKDAVGKITEEMQNQVLDYTSSSVFNITSESMKLSVGAVLNYILYGSNPNDITSADPMEILLDYFMSKYGIKPENVYKVSEYTIGFNALYVNEEGNLVIGIDDIRMEFDVYNNFKVFFDMFFKYITESIMCLFSDEPRDFNNAPDYRDNMPCDTSILDKTLNELDSAKEVTYHYVGKDT